MNGRTFQIRTLDHPDKLLGVYNGETDTIEIVLRGERYLIRLHDVLEFARTSQRNIMRVGVDYSMPADPDDEIIRQGSE